jgi:hypothetical protein
VHTSPALRWFLTNCTALQWVEFDQSCSIIWLPHTRIFDSVDPPHMKIESNCVLWHSTVPSRLAIWQLIVRQWHTVPFCGCMSKHTTDKCLPHGEIWGRLMNVYVGHDVTLFFKLSCTDVFFCGTLLNGCCKILLSNVFNITCYQVSFITFSWGFRIVKLK